MKYFSVIILTFFLGACWSSNDGANSDQTANEKNQNPSNQQVKKISNSNSELIPYKSNVAPEAANQENKSNVKIIKTGKSDEELLKEGTPAPDDSTFKARLDAEGYTGTRKFNNHPTLLKIEKKQKGKEITLKAYLKNGKVYDVSEEKVPNFRVNSPSHILSAIGLGPKVEPKKEINQEKINQLKTRNK